MLEKTVMDALVNAGGTALIAGIFIWYVDRLDKRTKSLIEDQFRKNNEILSGVEKALQGLTDAINRWDGLMKKKKL